jgi:isocitrate lyase
MLAYNCSPHLTGLQNYQLKWKRSAKILLQWDTNSITLAGFHALNTSMFELSKAYKERGMAGYSELQEREFALPTTL